MLRFFFSIDTDTDISKFDGNLILAASPKNKFQNIASIKRQFKHILFTQMCKKDKTQANQHYEVFFYIQKDTTLFDGACMQMNISYINMWTLNKGSRINAQHVSMGTKYHGSNVTWRRKRVLNTICWMVVFNLYLIYLKKIIYPVDSW